MTQEEILNEDKLLIARFLKLEISLYNQFIGEDQVNFTVDDLKYHKDWNWLMPVVEKIERLGYRFTISTTFVRVFTNKVEEYNCKLFDGKLKTTFHAVVEFIKWYNKQKSNERA